MYNSITKKMIVFDLDDTLAVTKSPITDTMSALLSRLLTHYEVCIISGGSFGQFKKQVIEGLEIPAEALKRMHLMPTCGTRYYRYNELEGDWRLQYANDLTDDQKQRITEALKTGAKELGLWEEKPYGDIIEDRGSQITFSALGQKAPTEKKYKWDLTGEKKHKLRDFVAPLVPDVEVRVGGATSIDVTIIGVDKAYGMRKLLEVAGFGMDDVLFIGDRLEEGGNDYPVKAMGIDTIAVERWEDTVLVVEALIASRN
ncbi:MAG TPA: HAD-IIB family hydrolase [Candidatus Saccharimonadales bacterium]